jgi:hypothetical protein
MKWLECQRLEEKLKERLKKSGWFSLMGLNGMRTAPEPSKAFQKDPVVPLPRAGATYPCIDCARDSGRFQFFDKTQHWLLFS